MASDRRCGTCRWFVVSTEESGDCSWRPNIPLPIAWDDGPANWVCEADGTNCPTWEARDA